MLSRKWIFAGALAVGMAAVALVDSTPAAAAGAGSNLVCKANGKVFKAVPLTIQGSYSKLLGNFILQSSKFSVNIKTRSASFKNILLVGNKKGLADQGAQFPVNLDQTVATYVNAPKLTLGSTADDAPAWAGENSEMTITIKGWKNGTKKVKENGQTVTKAVAKVVGTFSGSLPPGDNNLGAPNMVLSKGTFQATVYVVD